MLASVVLPFTGYLQDATGLLLFQLPICVAQINPRPDRSCYRRFERGKKPFSHNLCAIKHQKFQIKTKKQQLIFLAKNESSYKSRHREDDKRLKSARFLGVFDKLMQMSRVAVGVKYSCRRHF